mgnify:CR=1 FL=1
MVGRAKAASGAAGDAITIKKYANRRLYNTASSSYITLEDLARMVRENVDFQVLDAKTGDDITHSILTQIIMDEEGNPQFVSEACAEGAEFTCAGALQVCPPSDERARAMPA